MFTKSIVEEQARQVCENSIWTSLRFQKDTSISFTKRKSPMRKKEKKFNFVFIACLEIIEFFFAEPATYSIRVQEDFVKLLGKDFYFLPLQQMG
jgi:hypothetical protein